MVCAFIIQTLDSNDSEILYYRVYSSSSSEKEVMSGESGTTTVELNNSLFQTNIEKKDFLNFVVNKINMMYALKINMSLVPISQTTIIKGVFTERNWKKNQCEPFVVVWEAVHGLGFSMLCKKSENYIQAQNMMEIVISQLDKYLDFLSNPAVALKSIETVSLIINQFLPSGQILFLNSSFIQQFEKQLEKDLYSK
uniref:Uncharacterized protein n=1 Tax=Clastoptera arizonana TaxID=38151 RepID=A0A1B6CZV9_9HEMI